MVLGKIVGVSIWIYVWVAENGVSIYRVCRFFVTGGGCIPWILEYLESFSLFLIVLVGFYYVDAIGYLFIRHFSLYR